MSGQGSCQGKEIRFRFRFRFRSSNTKCLIYLECGAYLRALALSVRDNRGAERGDNGRAREKAELKKIG